MKSIIVLVALVLLPGSVEAAALYDGSGAYVQTMLDAQMGVDLETGATTSVIHATSSATAATNVGAIRAAIDVATEADLATYAELLETRDVNVDRVEASVVGEVVVVYYHPARLFGIFPLRAKSETTARISEGGRVEVTTRMPWWGFLATGTGSVAATVDADIENSGDVIADMKLSGSAAAKARVLEALTDAHARAAVAAAGL